MAPGNDVDRNAQLAEALGITTDELQTAYVKAANAAIDQAVADELLTETQAQTLRDRLSAEDGTGRGFDLGHFGGRGFGDSAIDFKALLADALGITTDELNAAETKAQSASLAQAVTDGNLTQEEADLMAARDAFRAYQIAQQPTFEAAVAAAVEAGAIHPGSGGSAPGQPAER
ncbi:MAG: hypothetical protein IPK16_29640 [Anaerolineales bacterium]|nr:hypothetical protein [Anaerolineales bacterium]